MRGAVPTAVGLGSARTPAVGPPVPDPKAGPLGAGRCFLSCIFQADPVR